MRRRDELPERARLADDRRELGAGRQQHPHVVLRRRPAGRWSARRARPAAARDPSSGTPRKEWYGSSPASRKYLNRGCRVASATTSGSQLLGDQAGQAFGRAHAHAPDALGTQPDRRRQHQVRPVGFEQVDRADIGVEPRLNQMDDVRQGFGGVAAAGDETTDLFERPEQRAFVCGDDGLLSR